MWEFLTRLLWFPFDIMQGLSHRFLHLGRSVYAGLFKSTSNPAIKPPPPTSSMSTKPPTPTTCPLEIPLNTSLLSSTNQVSNSSVPPVTTIASCVINMEPGQSSVAISTESLLSNTSRLSSVLFTSKPNSDDLELLSAIKTNTSGDVVPANTTIVMAEQTSEALVVTMKSDVVAARGDCTAIANKSVDDVDDTVVSSDEPVIKKTKRLHQKEKRKQQQMNQRNVAECSSDNSAKHTGEDLQSTQQAKKPKLSVELETSFTCQDTLNDNSAKRNKKKRSKKKKEVQQSIPSGESVKMGRTLPPNHFIAIQISNKDIISNVAQFQKSLTEKELCPPWHNLVNTEIFKDAMVPVSKLHFTLQVMHLDGEQDVEKAKTALDECCKQVHQDFLDNPIDFTIEGLGHFRNNVIFAQIKDESHITRLTQLSEIFRKKFEELQIPVDKRPFNPHMTIAKISRSTKLHKRVMRKIRSFPPGFMSSCEETNFGTQRVAGLQLLQMAGEDKATGYYHCLRQCYFVDPFCITNISQQNDSQND